MRWLVGGIALLVLQAHFVFHQLDAQSIWPDEAYSWDLAIKPVTSIVSLVLTDHVPGYFLLLHFWIKAAGETPFALRSMSSLTALAAVALLMSLVRSLAGWRPALLAGLIAVVNPFLLYYGQETRMYALLLALAALALRLCVVLCRRRATWWLWAGYSASIAAALYVHYYAVLLLPVLALAPIVLTAYWRKVWWKHLAAIGAACALFVPWALTHADVVNSFAPVTAQNATLQALLSDYFLNVSIGQIPFELSRQLDHEVLPWLLVGFMLALAVGGILRGLSSRPSRRLFAMVFVLPLAAAMVLTLGHRDFSPRHGIIALAGFIPLVALGVLSLPSLSRGVASLGLIGGLLWCDHLYFDVPAFQRGDFRGMVEYVERQAVPGDAVILLSDGPLRPLWRYYDARLTPVHLPLPLPAGEGALDTSLRAAIAGADRVHLFLWQDFADDPNHAVRRELDRIAFPLAGHGSGETAVYSYATQAPLANELPPDLNTAQATFSGQMELVGYREWSADNNLALRLQLTWRRLAPISRNFNVFVHEVDSQGRNVAIADHRPAFDTLDLTQWTTTPYLVDEYDLPGDWRLAQRLEIGLYDRASGERLSPDTLPLPLQPTSGT